MEKLFLPALLLTILLETGVLWMALKILSKDQNYPLPRVLFAGFFASFSTLPYVWFVIPLWIHSKYYLWVGEGGAIAIEALFFKQFFNLDWKKAFLISVLANLISYFIGIRLMAVFLG